MVIAVHVSDLNVVFIVRLGNRAFGNCVPSSGAKFITVHRFARKFNNIRSRAACSSRPTGVGHFDAKFQVEELAFARQCLWTV